MQTITLKVSDTYLDTVINFLGLLPKKAVRVDTMPEMLADEISEKKAKTRIKTIEKSKRISIDEL